MRVHAVKLPKVVIPVLAALAVSGLAASPAPSAAEGPATSGHGYWLDAIPESLEEAALRDALTRSAFAGAPGQAEALARVSAAHPGTAASGLAQLAAGWALVDAGKEADAVAYLTHPDIQKTALPSHAMLALGRAFEPHSPDKAAAAYVGAADADPAVPTACVALLRAAEVWAKAEPAKAAASLERALPLCNGQEPRVLLRWAEVQDSRGDARAAAALYDRVDRDYPASPEAHDGALRLKALAALLPAEPVADRRARAIRRGEALLEANQRLPAVAAFRVALETKPTGDELDLVRVRLAQSLLATGRGREAEIQLAAIGSGSPHAAEAAYRLAHERARRGSLEPYETVVERFPGTAWSEEALLQLANNWQKDARDAEAVPYFRRLLKDSPNGRYLERATWRVGFFDFQAARYEDAATLLEGTARRREPGMSTPGFLYWAGRARAAQGQTDRARALYDETARRFKHSYHGLRAREALAQLPPRPASAVQAASLLGPGLRTDVAEPPRTRVRQLLLIDRFDEAGDELRALPVTTVSQATLAWIEWRRGRLRNAIIAMKKAYPEYSSEAGDLLPMDVWRILYPIGFEDTLAAKASEEQLDPALVAALVCQESTFDPGAVSRAGARGLMQIMGPTGRLLARDLGVRYRRAALHDPATSLDFGTRYLRQMLDRFDGHVERALAAYNAGPHRVVAWTAGRPDLSAEEFVETIPFTETRFYVMTILAGREQYRRLYPLGPSPTAVTGGTRP